MRCSKCHKQITTVYKKGKPIKVLLESLHVYEQSAIIGKMDVEYSKRHIIHKCYKKNE